MKRILPMIMVVLLLGALTSTSYAVPHVMNFQGRITNDLNVPIEGTFNMTFDILRGTSSLRWTETISGIQTDQNGIFNVILGQSAPLIIFSGDEDLNMSIGVEDVASGTTFGLPPQELTAVPFAITSENVISDGRIDIKSDMAGFPPITGTPIITAKTQDSTAINALGSDTGAIRLKNDNLNVGPALELKRGWLRSDYEIVEAASIEPGSDLITVAVHKPAGMIENVILGYGVTATKVKVYYQDLGKFTKPTIFLSPQFPWMKHENGEIIFNTYIKDIGVEYVGWPFAMIKHYFIIEIFHSNLSPGGAAYYKRYGKIKYWIVDMGS